VKPDHIVPIDINSETVLGIRVEGAIAVVAVLTRSFQPDAQPGLGVPDHRFEIGGSFDVVMGGHGGIFPALAGGVKMDLAGSGVVVSRLGGCWLRE
jgi:hypothetical protein